MRFLILLALVASILFLETKSQAQPVREVDVSADANTDKLHTLEGELKVHPKYLYKYYIAFGNGQTCALYSAKHEREDDSLAVLEPGARIRVRGVLGTHFHRSSNTKDNPDRSPFGSAWILYMDVDSAELVNSKQHVAEAVKVGMTFKEVIKARGQHYRPFVGARVGSMVLVYDDISVDIFDYAPDSNILKGSVKYIQKTNLDDAARFLNDTPYADEK